MILVASAAARVGVDVLVVSTGGDCGERLSEAFGRRIRSTAAPFPRFAARMLRGRGLGPGFVLAMCGSYLTARLGFVGEVSDDYRELTGEEPTDFATLVADHAGARA